MIHFISHRKKRQQEDGEAEGGPLGEEELVSDPMPSAMHAKEGPLKALDDIDFKLAVSQADTVMDKAGDSAQTASSIDDTQITGAHSAVSRSADDTATISDRDLFSTLPVPGGADLDVTFASKVDESLLFSEDATAVDATPVSAGTSVPKIEGVSNLDELHDGSKPWKVEDTKEPWEVRDPWLEKILSGESDEGDSTIPLTATHVDASAAGVSGSLHAVSSSAVSPSASTVSDATVPMKREPLEDSGSMIASTIPSGSQNLEDKIVSASKSGSFNPEISGRFAVGPSGRAVTTAERIGKGSSKTSAATSSQPASPKADATAKAASPSATDADKKGEDFSKYQGQFAALNRIDIPGDQKHLSSYASRLADAEKNDDHKPRSQRRDATSSPRPSRAQAGAPSSRSGAAGGAAAGSRAASGMSSSRSSAASARLAGTSSNRSAAATSNRPGALSPDRSGSMPPARSMTSQPDRSGAIAAVGRDGGQLGVNGVQNPNMSGRIGRGNTGSFNPVGTGSFDPVGTGSFDTIDDGAEAEQDDLQSQNREPLAATMYDDLINWSSRLTRETPLFSRAFSVSNAQSVIDVGCGSGRHSVLFAQWGMSVIGIDQSNMMIKRARNFAEASMSEIREASGSVIFKRGTLAGLPRAIGNNMAEAIVCVGDVLPSVGSIAGLRSVLDSFAEFLVPMGVLVLEFSNHTRYTQQKIRATTPAVFDTSEGTKVFFSVMDYANGSPTIDADMLSLTCHDGRWRVNSEKVQNVFISPEIIQRELFDAGFDILELAGDYSGKPLDQFADESMIIIARRKAHRPSTGGFAPVGM